MDDYSGYGYGAGVSALIGLIWLIVLLAGPILYVITAWFLMNIFEKAGVQGKWRAWVPFYNGMIFFKLGDVSPWLLFGVFLTWIPFLGWLVGLAVAVMGILAAYRIGQKLQKDGAWIVLYILLEPVWLGILAFDSSRWNPNIPPSAWATNSFLADRTVWDGIPVQPSAAAAPGFAAPGYGAPQGYQPPAPQTILPRPATLPYATLQGTQPGDHSRRNSNLTGGPPCWGRSVFEERGFPSRPGA